MSIVSLTQIKEENMSIVSEEDDESVKDDISIENLSAKTKSFSGSEPFSLELELNSHKMNTHSTHTPITHCSSSNESTRHDTISEFQMLIKIKRFLTTLLQFASDINSETGDKAKELIFNLAASSISVSEFHEMIQELTQIPLRPFVLPFLQSNVPVLRQEISKETQSHFDCKTSLLPYIRSHPHLIFESSKSECKAKYFIFRKKRVFSCENQEETSSCNPKKFISSLGKERLCHQPWNHRSPCLESQQRSQEVSHQTDEWKNIQVMLNCILGMVEKTKRALSILQARSLTSTKAFIPPSSSRDKAFNNSISLRTPPPMGDFLSATLRNTEERVGEVRRRAEEAVLQVKRVAMEELQRAVSLADSRSDSTLKLNGYRLDCKTLMQENSEEDSSSEESKCWNCGRLACETCSGCNVARYCSQFCQHKDWEYHHKVCALAKSAFKDLKNSQENSESL